MIDSQTFIRFLLQLGLAITGAASLWSIVLYSLGKKTKDNIRAENLGKLANLLLPLFVAGLLLLVGSLVILKNVFYPALSLAHEGIIIRQTDDYIRNGLTVAAPFIFLLAFGGFLTAYLSRVRKEFFSKCNIFFFGSSFVLVSIIAGVILFTGSLNKLQFFYFLHQWHSIFTLGTVIVVDYLFFCTAKHRPLKAVMYPLFPIFSATIWSGLGIDFLSNLLIFPGAFTVNSQFLFIQTVIAVIILNGTLLSQRITDKLIGSVKPKNPLPLSQKVQNILGLSGSISAISWLTITFVDFFSFNLKYRQFLAYYLTAIVLAFVIHWLMNRKLRLFQSYKRA